MKIQKVFTSSYYILFLLTDQSVNFTDFDGICYKCSFQKYIFLIGNVEN